MNARERTLKFIKNEAVDRLPFHPLVMQFAAKQAGVPFGQYCQIPEKHVEATLHCVENFGLDMVMAGGYPFCEAIAYGLEVEFPENNLPLEKKLLILDAETDLGKIKPLNIEDHDLMMRRVELISQYREKAGDDLHVCGWFEGPLAEYADLRGLTGACMDIIDYPDEIEETMRIIVDNAKAWAKLQVQAGADCIGMGDAACSQIGPVLYEELVFDFHKELVEYIHSLGVFAKIHICGNITPLMPMLLETGANIIDIDHLVKDMSVYIDDLGPEQVLLGNIDPVSVIQDGTPELIREQTIHCAKATRGRGIVSAGCEIPRDTPPENFRAFFEAGVEASRLVL